MTNFYDTLLSFLPADLRNRQLRPYYIPLTTLALGGAATVQLTTPLQNVAAFLLGSITARVYTPGAPNASIADPGLTIEVRFSAGDDMTFGAVPFSSVVNCAGSPNANPGGLIIPRLVPGGSNIALTVTNYSGVAYSIRFGLDGINVYSS